MDNKADSDEHSIGIYSENYRFLIASGSLRAVVTVEKGLDSGSALTLTHSTVRNNAASVTGRGLGGGGIFNSSSLAVTKSNIQNNTVSGSGGGINSFGCSSIAIVTDSIVSDNSADSMGGGIFANLD